MAKFSGYGILIGSHNIMANGEKETRIGKHYGVSVRNLERNRLILKEFYEMDSNKTINRSSITPLLGKKFGVTPQQIRNILKKMRAR